LSGQLRYLIVLQGALGIVTTQYFVSVHASKKCLLKCCHVNFGIGLLCEKHRELFGGNLILRGNVSKKIFYISFPSKVDMC